MTEAVRNHVASAMTVPPNRIAVIENRVTADRVRQVDRSAARRQFCPKPQDFAIGVVGRICAQKGKDDMVEAALLLRQSLPHATALMIGAVEEAAMHARLCARIAIAGAGDRIRFCGHMPDIAAAYSGLDLLAAPSRWGAASFWSRRWPPACQSSQPAPERLSK